MTSPQVNGEVPPSRSAVQSSAFFQHLLNYPLVSDSIHSIQENEYGQRSILLGDSAYRTFAVPVLHYLAKPYEYVSPYLEKADSFADKALDRIDERFPVVKKPTGDLFNETRDLILLPYYKGLEGKDHVFKVYDDAMVKARGDNIVTHGKALVGTASTITNEVLTHISGVLVSKRDAAGNAIHAEATSNK